jgi:hypothetical protein
LAKSELEIALRNGDAEGARRIITSLAKPEESDPEKFVPISKRGGGAALCACFPKMEWSILHPSMNDLFLRLLMNAVGAYLQEQVAFLKQPAGRAFVPKLKRVVRALNASADAYRAAFEGIKIEAGFAGFMELLQGMSERAKTRCQTSCDAPKPKQQSGTLKAVYQAGKNVLDLFENLLDELGKFATNPNVDVADSKSPFRAIEKIGLDPEVFHLYAGGVGWNFSSLTDIVRGAVTIDSPGEGQQLIQELMACDDLEASFSPYKGHVQHIRDQIGGKGLAIVGVKNRFAEAGVAGEWRDVMVKFYFDSDPDKHVCEIQIMHTRLAKVREQNKMHDVYDDARNALELLAAAGLKV